MTTNELLAHSARPEQSIPPQLYRNHIENVLRLSVSNAISATNSSAKWFRFLDGVVYAAEYHDLGKIAIENQGVLRKSARDKLPIIHWDSGVAYLRRMAKEDSDRSFSMLLAAIIVYAHHLGLPDIPKERTKKDDFLREIKPQEGIVSTKSYTDQFLDDHLKLHFQERPNSLPLFSQFDSHKVKLSATTLRFALSCLVDADHSDTSLHYQQAIDVSIETLRPRERLQRLDTYVDSLTKNKKDDQRDVKISNRNRLRSLVYKKCKTYSGNRGIVSCDSPVGSGKTTAVMAHLLNFATKYDLRRIFVVLPYTNIIQQSVDVYRNAICLDGENPDQIVAEHHHRAEFTDPDSRHLSFSWQAPIVVTTAVQFFTTLAAADTGALRKLHQVSRSAIFIDESHAALPAHLWPIAFKWLRDLVEDWDCHVVLGSGSQVKFWTLPEFQFESEEPLTVPAIVPDEVASQSSSLELKRIEYKTTGKRLSLKDLVEWVQSFDGPRLLIVNTVQSAAVIAKAIAGLKRSVEHISTALSPDDRDSILELVSLRLKDKSDRDWTLVATSCVEAGVDFSFRVGFRERSTLNSLLQTAGRVNRSGKYENSVMWDFELIHDEQLRAHPALEVSSIVVGQLFDEGKISPDFCTEAMKREIGFAGFKDEAKMLCESESALECREVANKFRVIDSDTVTAIVSVKLLKRIQRGEKVRFVELQRGSVQIYRNRLLNYALEEVPQFPGVFRWTLKYNKKLGYMAGVLENSQFLEDGGCCV